MQVKAHDQLWNESIQRQQNTISEQCLLQLQADSKQTQKYLTQNVLMQ